MKTENDNIELWRSLLRQIPVSINNYYGDPLIQWQDTLKKLHELEKSKHSGPIGIITKGKITEDQAKILSQFCKNGLKIVVLISISELKQHEKVGHEHRYENIRLLNKYQVKNIAYVRPLTPPYNTSKQVIDDIFKKLNKAGAKVVVASGFRGDDNIVHKMTPEKVLEWTMRVKLMTKEVYQYLKSNSEKYQMKLFTRTACAISYLCGLDSSYNPYYNSNNLAKCNDLNCPLKLSCQAPAEPRAGSLDFIRFLGYEVKLVQKLSNIQCNVTPENRLKCPSCCTTCYMLDVSRIEVSGKVSLGDLSFIRFITGMLTVQKGLADNGDKDIANIAFPNFPEIKGLQCINSWFPYAHIGTTCFGCSYCIEKYYTHKRKNFGLVPAKLINLLICKDEV